MTFGGAQRVVVTAFVLLVAFVLLFAWPRMLAQTASGTGTLRGQVTDPSGSSIANATVIVTTPTGNAITATTNREGIYEIKNLAQGKYGVKVISQGFAPFETSNVEVLAGQIQKLDVPLTIEVREEKVTVTDQAAAAFNSKSPFVQTQPGYETTQFSGNVGGPLSKKASFFFNLERRDINDSSVIDAKTLDSNFNPVTFSEAIANPRRRTNLSPRLDYQLGTNNTLTARYQFFRESETNGGV